MQYRLSTPITPFSEIYGPCWGLPHLVFFIWITMSLIKTYLLERERLLTPEEVDFECGGPVPPDFDVINEQFAQQVWYSTRAAMESMPERY